MFTDFFTGFWGGGFRIAYGFLADFGEEASGLFTDFFTGFWGGGFRIVYGFLPDFGEEASRFLGRKGIGRKGLADCFWIRAGFGDLGEKAYGFGTGEVWVLKP